MSTPRYIVKALDSKSKWWRVGEMVFNPTDLSFTITLDPYVYLPQGSRMVAFSDYMPQDKPPLPTYSDP